MLLQLYNVGSAYLDAPVVDRLRTRTERCVVLFLTHVIASLCAFTLTWSYTDGATTITAAFFQVKTVAVLRALVHTDPCTGNGGAHPALLQPIS